MKGETIIAQSTPWGVSGLAVIRISGPDCNTVIEKALLRATLTPRRMYYGRFVNPINQACIDDLNYVYLREPSSYTGEDMLELFPHGNPYIVRKILKTLLKIENIRLAEPGEFTRRRLESGKMDIIQAEAVGQLIHAENDIILQNARRMLSGELSAELEKLEGKLKDLSLRMELDIDFVEEELDPDYDLWGKELEEIRTILQKLLFSWERSRQLQQVPRVAFLGKPNAGKSSLINSILRQNRLIVSSEPGTTRDFVEIPINLTNGLAILVDTAGICHAETDIDKMAVQKTKNLEKAADIKVLVVDGTSNCAIKEKQGFDITVFTKKDLSSFRPHRGDLDVSNITGEGIDCVLDLLNARIFRGESKMANIMLATQRQFEGVKTALQNIENALIHLKGKPPAAEILAFELREAKNRMSGVLGQYDSEEILSEIFKNFCIGK